jgi:sugar lactone lactonase YvrE
LTAAQRALYASGSGPTTSSFCFLEMFVNYRPIIAVLGVGITVAACNAQGSGYGNVSPAAVSNRITGTARESDSSGSLYISSENPNALVVYGGQQMKFLRLVTRGVDDPRGMAINSLNQAIVANYHNDTVAVIGSGPVRILSKGVSDPTALGVSPANDVYVMSRNFVNIFENARQKGFKRIHLQASAVAFDSFNNAYIAADGAVSVFAQGATKPKRTITEGIGIPVAVAIDTSGNLYVGNYVSTKDCGDVTEYNAATGALENTITDGVCYPISIAFDLRGNVYVANHTGSSVTVYDAGTNALKETITSGVSNPISVLVDPSGNLYVANYNSPGSVAVYQPDKTSPSKILTKYITLPFALGWMR